jgi:hypothetical protein
MKIHTLNKGATVLSLSLHPFTFSDGSVAEGQDEDVVDEFTLRREFTPMPAIAGMKVNRTSMVLSKKQMDRLTELSTMDIDIVIVPFPVLTALREQGVRDNFPNCVAFNATIETQRSPPNEKIVDIDNWSY